jgi:hypothetical protein
MDGEEWGVMVQKLDKINALLKPYREDPVMSKTALIVSLERAALELERNACTLHDAQRWQSAAANLPKSKLHEVRPNAPSNAEKTSQHGRHRLDARACANVQAVMERVAAQFNALDQGITKVCTTDFFVCKINTSLERVLRALPRVESWVRHR